MIGINLSLKPILNVIRAFWDQLFAPILTQIIDFLVLKSGLPDEVVITIFLWTAALTFIPILTKQVVKQLKETKY